MQRLEHWRRDLYAAVGRAAASPFNWRSNHCVTFIGDGILAQTGIDIIGPFRDRFDDAAGARRMIRESGACNLLELVGRYLKPCPPAACLEGDVVMLETAAGGVGFACGLILGSRIGVMAPTGYGSIDRGLAQYGFKI